MAARMKGDRGRGVEHRRRWGGVYRSHVAGRGAYIFPHIILLPTRVTDIGRPGLPFHIIRHFKARVGYIR